MRREAQCEAKLLFLQANPRSHRHRTQTPREGREELARVRVRVIGCGSLPYQIYRNFPLFSFVFSKQFQIEEIEASTLFYNINHIISF